MAFTLIDHDPGHVGKGQTGHRDTVGSGRQVARLVPSVAGGHDAQLVELQLRHRTVGQLLVRQVWWVERATEHAYAHALPHQSQSLTIKNSCVKRASGEPGGSWRWYDHETVGGMDIKIDSVRPPDCRPK
jgi:hypothetical protein